MMTIKNLIESFCNEEEKREGYALYRGVVCNYLGFDRHLTRDFKPLNIAFNGHREVYFSKEKLCNVTTCEGDVTICVYDSVVDFENGYKNTVEFYKEN